MDFEQIVRKIYAAALKIKCKYWFVMQWSQIKLTKKCQENNPSEKKAKLKVDTPHRNR